jgi:hypothetical protein
MSTSATLSFPIFSRLEEIFGKKQAAAKPL